MTAAVLAIFIIVSGMYFAGSDETADSSHVHICVGHCTTPVEPCDKDHEHE